MVMRLINKFYGDHGLWCALVFHSLFRFQSAMGIGGNCDNNKEMYSKVSVTVFNVLNFNLHF